MAARRLAQGRARVDSGALRHRASRLLRHFVPRPGRRGVVCRADDVRISSAAPINDPRSLFRPNLKIVHRADPEVNVSIGAQRADRLAARAAARVVPDRVLPLPGSQPRTVRAEVRPPADRARTDPEPVLRPRSRADRRQAGSRSSTTRSSSMTTPSSAASRTARSSSTRVCATRCATLRRRAGDHVSTADGCRRGGVRGRRRGTRAKRTSCACSGGSTRSNNACSRSSVDRALRIERKLRGAAKKLRPAELATWHEARPHGARARRGGRHRRADRLPPQCGRRLRHRDRQQLAGRHDGDPRGV